MKKPGAKTSLAVMAVLILTALIFRGHFVHQKSLQEIADVAVLLTIAEHQGTATSEIPSELYQTAQTYIDEHNRIARADVSLKDVSLDTDTRMVSATVYSRRPTLPAGLLPMTFTASARAAFPDIPQCELVQTFAGAEKCVPEDSCRIWQGPNGEKECKSDGPPTAG